MKSLYLLYLSLGFIFIVRYSEAQTVKPKVLSSAGGSVTVSGVQVSRSIGETFIIPSPTNTVSVSRGFQQNTSTISVNTITPSTFCSGASIVIPFTAVDIFGSDNVFTAELSDIYGSFTSPVTIGTLTSNSSGSINGIIPLNSVTATGYRVRVRSSSPVVISGANNASLTINQTPSAQASSTGPYNVGQTIELHATGGTTYHWSGPNSFSSSEQSPKLTNSIQANAGIYSVTVSANACSATATTNVIIHGVDPCVRVVDYYYVKAGNPYQVLFPLSDGLVIDQIPQETSIVLIPACETPVIGSFELNMQGPELNWNIVQNVLPYTVFDNIGTNVFGRNFQPGEYTLTATGYAEDNKGGGKTYGPVIIKFTVVGNLATISMPALSTTSLCAGSSVDVSFTTTGSFDAGNTFEVQLSNADGNFEVPTPFIIGTSDSPGTVHCTIPLSVTESSKYLIRVASSNQILAGNPNISFLNIYPYYKTVATNINSGTDLIKASGEITGNNKITSPAVVTYQANKAIILNPGFEATSGVFKATIKACAE